MFKGVLLAVGGLLVGGFLLHLITLILILALFWSDGFLYDTLECFLALAASALTYATLRVFIPKAIEDGEFKALSPPRRITVIFRFFLSASVCLFTIAYCTSIVYFGLVQPGYKAPVFVVYSIWMLSFFPMIFFMTRALRGVYYDGLPVSTIDEVENCSKIIRNESTNILLQKEPMNV